MKNGILAAVHPFQRRIEIRAVKQKPDALGACAWRMVAQFIDVDAAHLLAREMHLHVHMEHFTPVYRSAGQLGLEEDDVLVSRVQRSCKYKAQKRGPDGVPQTHTYQFLRRRISGIRLFVS